MSDPKFKTNDRVVFLWFHAIPPQGVVKDTKYGVWGNVVLVKFDDGNESWVGECHLELIKKVVMS